MILTTALVGVAGPAAAHDELISTDPADGAVLTQAPTAVVLVFAAPQAGIGAEVVITGPDGATWSDGPAQVAETTVTQPLPAGLPDGAYTVTWRSVAQDGHPVSGTFGFGLDTSAVPTPTEAEPVEETPAADPAAGAVGASSGVAPVDEPVPASDAAPVAEASVVAQAPDEAGSAGWRWWYPVVLVAAAAGIAAWLVGRRRAADG